MSYTLLSTYRKSWLWANMCTRLFLFVMLGPRFFQYLWLAYHDKTKFWPLCIGRCEIQQGTGESFKFSPIDKLTPSVPSQWKIMLTLVIWPSMVLLEWTETKLWTLKFGSKSIQTSLILRQRPPKSYKLLQILWFPWYWLKWANIAIFISAVFKW